jgi:predicted nucleotidyltransferase
MKLSGLESIFRSLNEANIRYLIVGGVAVNAHGYGRSTYDVDIVLAMDPVNIIRTFGVLAQAGYTPVVPVTPEEFADRDSREHWRREKGMVVLPMTSDHHPDAPLDLFVTEPFVFSEEHDSALWLELAPGLSIPVIRLETLLAMKRSSGRPKDLADLDELNLLYGKPSSYDEEQS